MLQQYETTFILTPVLSDDDAKTTINGFVDLLKAQGAEVVTQDHWGLKNLKYAIKRKTTGLYHLVEFKAPAAAINVLEIAYRRDENVLRYLTVKLDKHAVAYNDSRRGKEKKVRAPKKTVEKK